MQKDSFEFLTRMLETPSPSGFETKLQQVVKKRVAPFADEVKVDVHGNLIAVVNPGAKVRVMLAGHCDQIGFMVTYIDDNGFLCFRPIGGIDPAVVPGSMVQVLTRSGVVPGVIGWKPVHLVPQPERGKPLEIKRMWIDIGAKNGDAARKLVSVGDPVVYEPTVTRLGENTVAAPGCDDRVGVFVVMEALRLFKQLIKRTKSPVSLYAVSTVQEELGKRGAQTSCFGVDPLVGIAVDVTHASDNPGAEAKEVGVAKLGSGPVLFRGPNINPVLEELLFTTAKKKKIPCQQVAAPGITGTDAGSMQISRSGVAAALVSIPNRYMHTPVEIIDLRDLTLAAKLVAEAVMRINSRMTFIPV